MNKKIKIAPYIKLQNDKKINLEKQLLQHQKNMDLEIQNLNNLKKYKTDYKNVIFDKCKTGITAANLIACQAFIKKLEGAINQQNQKVIALNTQYGSLMNEWKQMSNKCKVLDEIADRYKRDIELADDALEQKQLDDLSQLKYIRQKD